MVYPETEAKIVWKAIWRTAGRFFLIASLISISLPITGIRPSQADTLQPKGMAYSINSFAMDLYGKLASPEENLIFSPYSVFMALGMAYSGARGTTKTQMAKALHLNLPQAGVNKAFAEVASQILSAGKEGAVEIDVANALWTEESYPFLKEYLECVKASSEPRGWFSQLFAEGPYRQVDFKRNPDASRHAINKWAEAQTRNKIKDLLPPGAVDELTRLVLTSVIYFRGKWERQFEKELTRDDTFTTTNETAKMVPMMYQKALFGYVEESGLQVLEMGYRSQDLSMVVLLPSKERPHEDFEQSITPDKLDRWEGKLQLKTVEVFLPRFKMTSRFDLTEPLSNSGMKDAFANADFSGMTGNRDLFISKIIHKVFAETNEGGTEAAAATAGLMMRKAERIKKSPSVPIFRADHPFVFLIRHRPSNCILFLGRVTDPLSK